jgi:hypothetical protein
MTFPAACEGQPLAVVVTRTLGAVPAEEANEPDSMR